MTLEIVKNKESLQETIEAVIQRKATPLEAIAAITKHQIETPDGLQPQFVVVGGVRRYKVIERRVPGTFTDRTTKEQGGYKPMLPDSDGGITPLVRAIGARPELGVMGAVTSINETMQRQIADWLPGDRDPDGRRPYRFAICGWGILGATFGLEDRLAKDFRENPDRVAGYVGVLVNDGTLRRLPEEIDGPEMFISDNPAGQEVFDWFPVLGMHILKLPDLRTFSTPPLPD